MDADQQVISNLFPPPSASWTAVLRQAIWCQTQALELVPSLDKPPAIQDLRQIESCATDGRLMWPWGALARDRDQRLVLFVGYPASTGTGMVIATDSLNIMINRLINSHSWVASSSGSVISQVLVGASDISPDILTNMIMAGPPIMRQMAVTHRLCPHSAWIYSIQNGSTDDLAAAASNPVHVADPECANWWTKLMQERLSRHRLAANPNCSSDLLLQLINCKDPETVHMVMDNPQLPEEYRVLHRVAH